MEGAIYEWDLQLCRRCGESVLRGCNYFSAAVSPDAKTIYAVGSDKMIKEVSDSQVGVRGGVRLPGGCPRRYPTPRWVSEEVSVSQAGVRGGVRLPGGCPRRCPTPRLVGGGGAG